MIPHSRPIVKPDEEEVVVAALRAGHLSQGEEVGLLEHQLSVFFKGLHVVVVSSGTAALYLSLRALGVSSSDHIIIPSYTCNSLYAAVAHVGAKSVLADVSALQITLDKASVAAVRTAADVSRA